MKIFKRRERHDNKRFIIALSHHSVDIEVKGDSVRIGEHIFTRAEARTYLTNVMLAIGHLEKGL